MPSRLLHENCADSGQQLSNAAAHVPQCSAPAQPWLPAAYLTCGQQACAWGREVEGHSCQAVASLTPRAVQVFDLPNQFNDQLNSLTAPALAWLALWPANQTAFPGVKPPKVMSKWAALPNIPLNEFLPYYNASSEQYVSSP